jgi:PAS domain S-box-containing protein
MTILIIEDDAGLSELIQEILEELGFKTVCLQSAGESISWLENQQPYLMILDYNLPDMNGKELIAELKNHGLTIPSFIVSTGQGDERIAVEMMKLGARDYVVKDKFFLERLPEVILRVSREIENENKRTLAEEALKESEEKFRILFDDSPIPTLLSELPSGKIAFANKRFLKEIKMSLEEVIGKNGAEIGLLHNPNDQEKLTKLLINQGFADDVEVEYLYPNGITGTDLVSLRLIMLNGKPFCLTVMLDITERKKVEGSLIQSEEKYRVLFESMPNGFYRSTPEGYFVDVNPAFVKMLSYDNKEELLKVNIPNDIFVHASERNELSEDNDDFVKNVEIYRLKTKDGRIIWIEDNARYIKDENGKVLFHEGICRDITERKQAEQDLKIALSRAEESDRLKTAFLQNMSHEIRTPLNGIIGFAKLLQHKGNSMEEVQEFTDIIQQSGNRLIEIVNNVLDISKIETGQIIINNKSFSINSLIYDMYSFFSHIVNDKGLKLNYHTHSDEEFCIITSDESKLNQIFTNLINNAIKFTSAGSIDYGYEIINSPSEGLKPLKGCNSSDTIQFYVKDTGIGISSELHEKIFDRFTQVEDSIGRNFEGAGLGLAICKGLVGLLGGKIWLESEINKGTTFFFTLPYISSAISAQTNKIKSVSSLPKKSKILIVEDDFVSFKYLRRILKSDQFVLLFAENGEQSIELVNNTPDIDLILMDIRMPVMNGIEATKQIKSIRPDLPVIAQTAYAFTEEKEQILSAGFNDYMSKPLDKDKLFKMIAKYIS